ncbi:periplasmic heavy metal sensor [bacterium]|nr:periplasmic heavy metal sensor [bacterium]
MASSNKKKFYTGLFIFLVVANIVSLSALWYTLYKKDIPVPHPVMAGPDRKPKVMDFLCDRLNLNPSQIAEFEKMRRDHFNQIRHLNDDIRPLRKNLFNEIFKENPDTAKIGMFARKIGYFSGLREKFIAQHFEALTKVCNNRQRRVLQELVDRSSKRFSNNGYRDTRNNNMHHGRKNGKRQR